MFFSLALAALSLRPAAAFEIVAHRGVHQEYSRQDLSNETCTAQRIEPPTHPYLENTLASIERAFELGATMVEIDVHPTTEPAGASSQMVVFHDWTVNCRTEATCRGGCKCSPEGECVTHDQSLAFLKSLDIGHGYTADGGKTFPFRGKHRGEMPQLEEALKLLEKYPDRKLLVNLKDKMRWTVETFIRIIGAGPPAIRSRVLFDRGRFPDLDQKLAALGVPEAIYQSGKSAMDCFKRYLFTGALGYFPEACRNRNFFIMTHETLGRLHPWLDSVRFVDVLWGWPDRFIEKARRHGTKIYPSQVETLGELAHWKKYPVDGIMTNRIEVIGQNLRPNPAPSFPRPELSSSQP